MATEDVEDALEQGDSEKASGGGKKKLLFIILAVFLLGGGGAAAYFLGVFDPPAEEDALAEEEVEQELTGECGAAFLELPELTVNLNSSGGRTTFLRLTLALELRQVADVAAIEPLVPRLVDQFQVFLRELRIDDLRGSQGAARLREELLYRVNLAVDPVPVCTVRFQNLIFQ